MNRWIPVVVSALLLGGACVTQDDFCQRSSERCEVKYDRNYGYYRDCRYIAGWCTIGMTVPGSAGAGGSAGAQSAQAAGSGGSASASDATDDDAQQSSAGSGAKEGDDASKPPAGAAQPPGTERYSAFEFDCTRDSQCGPGRCLEGDCYYGCSSDAECGSGDRCSVESGTRICLPDPNPPVECTRTAQCSTGHVCLNGACRQQCDDTEECDNLLDRCLSGVCTPDRRPLGECVLDVECAEGLACLDGKCVEACASDPKAGKVCSGNQPAPDPTKPDDSTDDDQGGEQPDAGALPQIQ